MMSDDNLTAINSDVSSVSSSATDATPKGWLDSITGGNQFMSAGLGVMAVGAGLAVARQSVRRAAGFAKHQMLGKQSSSTSDKLMADSRE